MGHREGWGGGGGGDMTQDFVSTKEMPQLHPEPTQ